MMWFRTLLCFKYFCKGNVLPKTQAESNLDDPQEMFAWIFAAGIPDARGEKYPHQPMIPGPNMPAVSQMLYDFGCRFHPELQEKWVKPAMLGIDRNFQAWGVTDVMPNAAEMLADIAPDKAMAVANVTPETHAAALQEVTAKMLENLERLREAAASPGAD